MWRFYWERNLDTKGWAMEKEWNGLEAWHSLTDDYEDYYLLERGAIQSGSCLSLFLRRVQSNIYKQRKLWHSWRWGWGWITNDGRSASVSWFWVPNLGPWQDFYFVIYNCSAVVSFLKWGVLSTERLFQNLLVQLSDTLGTDYSRTRHSNLLSGWRLIQPWGPGPRIYISQEKGGPVITPDTETLSVASYNSQAYGRGIRTASTWDTPSGMVTGAKMAEMGALSEPMRARKMVEEHVALLRAALIEHNDG